MQFKLSRGLEKLAIELIRLWTSPILTFRIRDDRLSVSLFNDAVRTSAQQTIDDRLAHIEAARKSLETALVAIDELKDTADKNKAELDDALKRLQAAEQNKAAIEQAADLAKQAAGVDVGAFRRVMGIPSTGQVAIERAIGFGTGVAASLVASFVWGLISRT